MDRISEDCLGCVFDLLPCWYWIDVLMVCKRWYLVGKKKFDYTKIIKSDTYLFFLLGDTHSLYQCPYTFELLQNIHRLSGTKDECVTWFYDFLMQYYKDKKEDKFYQPESKDDVRFTDCFVDAHYDRIHLTINSIRHGGYAKRKIQRLNYSALHTCFDALLFTEYDILRIPYL